MDRNSKKHDDEIKRRFPEYYAREAAGEKVRLEAERERAQKMASANQAIQQVANQLIAFVRDMVGRGSPGATPMVITEKSGLFRKRSTILATWEIASEIHSSSDENGGSHTSVLVVTEDFRMGFSEYGLHPINGAAVRECTQMRGIAKIVLSPMFIDELRMQY